MLIKPIRNFVHAPSRRSFTIGKIETVTEHSGKEFIDAELAVEVKPEPVAEVKPVKAKKDVQ